MFENVGGGAFLAAGRALSQVLYSNVIAHLLCNLEYVIKRSGTWCAMTVLNILNERSEFSILCEGFIRGHKVQSTRDQVSIRILRYYVIKAAVSFVKFFLPLLGKDNRMGNNNPYPPQPSPIGDGVSNSHPELVSGSHLVQQQVKHNANSLKRTYSPIHLFTHSLKKRAAFTLAEILITLGIIGIVAAMTLPSLIQNVRNRQLESALKKNASVIAQALDMYRAENGVSIVSNLHTHEFKPEIIKYFNILKDCGFGYNDDSACIKNYGSSNSDKNSNTYKNFSGTASIDLSWFDDGQFVLTDGSLILLENNNNLDGTPGNIYISIDVNGYNKRPNRLGQDLFMFQVNNEGKLLPMGVDGSNFYSANDTYCSKSSTHKDNGAGCTYKALSDSSFWKNLP